MSDERQAYMDEVRAFLTAFDKAPPSTRKAHTIGEIRCSGCERRPFIVVRYKPGFAIVRAYGTGEDLRPEGAPTVTEALREARSQQVEGTGVGRALWQARHPDGWSPNRRRTEPTFIVVEWPIPQDYRRSTVTSYCDCCEHLYTLETLGVGGTRVVAPPRKE